MLLSCAGKIRISAVMATLIVLAQMLPGHVLTLPAHPPVTITVQGASTPAAQSLLTLDFPQTADQNRLIYESAKAIRSVRENLAFGTATSASWWLRGTVLWSIVCI
jgi:hypothetical protein